MKEIVLTLVYRYHYWTFEVKRFFYIALIYSPCKLIYHIFPNAHKTDVIDYNHFNNPKRFYYYLKKSYNNYSSYTFVSGVRHSPINFITAIVIYSIGILLTIRTMIVFLFFIALCIPWICDYIYKKTGYAFTFGPNHKKYFFRFMEESKVINLAWFTFFTVVFILIEYLLIKFTIYW